MLTLAAHKTLPYCLSWAEQSAYQTQQVYSQLDTVPCRSAQGTATATSRVDELQQHIAQPEKGSKVTSPQFWIPCSFSYQQSLKPLHMPVQLAPSAFSVSRMEDFLWLSASYMAQTVAASASSSSSALSAAAYRSRASVSAFYAALQPPALLNLC